MVQTDDLESLKSCFATATWNGDRCGRRGIFDQFGPFAEYPLCPR